MPASRYTTFDGLRGFAALAILLFHMEGFLTPGRLLGHGYLAVDLFFAISGFVIAHSYEARLGGGMGFMTFAARRLMRLWPMALAGLALTLAYVGLTSRSLGAGELAAFAIAGALFLPNLAAPAGMVLWLNGPAWSLHFELIANALYAVQRGRWSRTFLVGLIGAAYALLVVWVSKFGTIDGAADAKTYLSGLGRVFFGFPLGVLIHRLHADGALPRLAAPPWLLVGACALMFACPATPALRGATDLVFLAVVIPLVVALGAQSRPDARTARVFRALGELSYPLYCVHAPIIAALVAAAIGSGAPRTAWPLLAVPIMAAAIGAAWGAHRLLERPRAQARAPALAVP